MCRDMGDGSMGRQEEVSSVMGVITIAYVLWVFINAVFISQDILQILNYLC